MRYDQLQDGEWCRPAHRGFREQCCDCGLVHTVDFQVCDHEGRPVKLPRGWFVRFRASRNPRATAAVRRAFKFEKDE